MDALIRILLVLFLVATSRCDELGDEVITRAVSGDEISKVKADPKQLVSVKTVPGANNVLETSGDVIFSDSLETSNDIVLNDSIAVDKLGLNETSNETNAIPNKTKVVECEPRVLPEEEIPIILVSDGTTLLKVLSSNGTNSTVGECIIVLFYASQCVFSARIAPHYNALARVFPGITMYAMDTNQHKTVHIRYGVVAVPTVLLFHNGKVISKFNSSETSLFQLTAFVTKHTNLTFNDTLNVTSADMTGPVPAILIKSVDYFLILAWVFTIFCLCFWFLKSSLCHKIVECIRNTWLEAEEQHEHAD